MTTGKINGGKEMRRKYLVLAGVLCIITVAAGGCKSGEEETVKNIKIGVTLYDQYDTFISEMMTEFTEYAADKEEESGVAINVEIMDASQSQPLFVENIDQSKAALDAFMAENDKEPRLILVQGVGAFIMEDDKGKAAKAQLLVKDAIKLAVYAESFGGPLHMTDDITYFITHWEAEAYRSKK